MYLALPMLAKTKSKGKENAGIIHVLINGLNFCGLYIFEYEYNMNKGY